MIDMNIYRSAFYFVIVIFSMQALAKAQTMGPMASHSTAAPSSIAGVDWSVPAKWKAQGEKPMRVATYAIPAAPGDTEGGECAVFFFGTGQGGDVQTNINRWISQFEPSSKPDQSSKVVNGIKVDLVTVSGTYLAPGGPMMQSQGKKPNYKLLGAIAEAPDGLVFFKSTGPANTMVAAQKDFDSLLNSLKKAK